MTDDRLRVLIYHVRDVAAEIAAFVSGTTREQLQKDVFAERGLIMSLHMIADLATRIQTEHPEFTATLPYVPWKDIRGLRNRVAHGHFELDIDVLWRSAVEDAPALAEALVASLDPPHTGT